MKQKKWILIALGCGLALALGLLVWVLWLREDTVPPPASEDSTTAVSEASVSVPDPDASFPEVPNLGPQTLTEALYINDDVTGWLTVPGTSIDAPVLQAANNETYLRRNIYGDYDIWGCYFLDYECNAMNASALTRVSIVYGHSLEDYTNAQHFSQLKRYTDADFCAANPQVTLTTRNGEEIAFTVFAAGVVDVELDYLNPNPSDEQLRALLDAFATASVQPFEGQQAGLDDQLLILSTCTSDDTDRFVVVAKRA